MSGSDRHHVTAWAGKVLTVKQRDRKSGHTLWRWTGEAPHGEASDRECRRHSCSDGSRTLPDRKLRHHDGFVKGGRGCVVDVEAHDANVWKPPLSILHQAATQHVRAACMEDDDWKAYLGKAVHLMREMANQIMLPAPHSPLR